MDQKIAAMRPNVILFGIGHSGTSIATKMLHALGWCDGDADQEFAESVSIREVNEAALHGHLNEEAASKALKSLPQPWALKDPRFVHTIEYWYPLFTDYEPVLVWLFRNPDSIAASYRRRNEQLRFGLSVNESCELAGQTFAQWPWMKLLVTYENLRDAVRLFDVERAT